MEKLRDFIAFARKCQPQLSEATAEDLIANYLQLRRAGQSRKVRLVSASLLGTLCCPLWQSSPPLLLFTLPCHCKRHQMCAAVCKQ